MPRTWASACVFALVAVLAAGCGGHEATEAPTPLVATGGVAAGGAGVLGSYPTTLTADYTPNRNFGLAFGIQNRSDEPVTIVGVSSNDESEKRFAHLVGASATAFVPIDCDGHSCPATDLGLGPPPYGALPALAPLTIPAHQQASIQLHFRWVSCLDSPGQTSDRENTTLIVNYRSGGKTASQLLHTGAAQLHVSATSTCSVEVPDLIGMKYRPTQELLAKLGLRWGAIGASLVLSEPPPDNVSSSADEDLVTQQNPSAGTKVEPGAVVRIRTSCVMGKLPPGQVCID